MGTLLAPPSHEKRRQQLGDRWAHTSPALTSSPDLGYTWLSDSEDKGHTHMESSPEEMVVT